MKDLIVGGSTRARALRQQAREGGLRFEAYLPPRLADWLLDHIEKGRFANPGEAIFALVGEHVDLEGHPDLRQELLRRLLAQSAQDGSPSIPADEVFQRLRDRSKPRPAPADWKQ